MTLDKLIPPLRDLICLALGSYGFIWQVSTNSPDPTLMAGCIAVLGGPAVMAAVSLGRQGGGPDTTGSPSPSPVLPSPSPLSSPSSSAGGEAA